MHDYLGVFTQRVACENGVGRVDVGEPLLRPVHLLANGDRDGVLAGLGEDAKHHGGGPIRQPCGHGPHGCLGSRVSPVAIIQVVRSDGDGGIDAPAGCTQILGPDRGAQGVLELELGEG